MIDGDRNGGDRPAPGAGNGAGRRERKLPSLGQASRRDDTGEPHDLRFGEDPGGADATLGGYFAVHNRPPAFEGSDGQPYTVAVDVEETDDPERPFVAFLIFLRWASSGAGIMEHIESDDIAHGRTEDEARQGALSLPLLAVRAALDAAIDRRRRDLSW
ncbi:MAG TPA: hypothetical protein VNZ57_04560 [Longimicrobiales bacterium]|nr:hypothetical protein [Longimicrobiales bacterium]